MQGRSSGILVKIHDVDPEVDGTGEFVAPKVFGNNAEHGVWGEPGRHDAPRPASGSRPHAIRRKQGSRCDQFLPLVERIRPLVVVIRGVLPELTQLLREFGFYAPSGGA